MQQDDCPVDEREPQEGVLELRPGLRAVDHGGAVDGVGVVAPALLDLLDEHLALALAGTVDCQVVQDAPQPGGGGGLAAKARAPLKGAEKGILHEILGCGVVARERDREAVERRGMLTGDRLEPWSVETCPAGSLSTPRYRLAHRPLS